MLYIYLHIYKFKQVEKYNELRIVILEVDLWPMLIPYCDVWF